MSTRPEFRRVFIFLTLLGAFCLAFPLYGKADPRVKEIKERADAAVVKLHEMVSDGYDVENIVPKMKQVKVLGQAGKFEEVSALLDDISLDFKEQERKEKPNGDRLFINEKVINIEGYDGDVMETFITRDGRYMFFNSMKRGKKNKDIYYAERLDDYNFKFLGEIQPINTKSVDAVPVMDDNGVFYFLCTDDYRYNNRVSVRVGMFKDGVVSDVEQIKELSINKPGWLNMDSEISADGETLYSTQSFFKADTAHPSESYFFYAKKIGAFFVPQKDSEDIFININNDDVVFGIGISRDELKMVYTRYNEGKNKLESLIAARIDKSVPFGIPNLIRGMTGLSEAPGFNHREDMIYYHKRSPKDGKFRAYALHVNPKFK